MSIYKTAGRTFCMLPLIISCKVIEGVVRSYIGTAWRHEFVFLTQVESVIDGNIVSIAFGVFLQAKTVRVNADQFRQLHTADVYGNGLIRLDHPLVTKNEIPINTKYQSA